MFYVNYFSGFRNIFVNKCADVFKVNQKSFTFAYFCNLEVILIRVLMQIFKSCMQAPCEGNICAEDKNGLFDLLNFHL